MEEPIDDIVVEEIIEAQPAASTTVEVFLVAQTGNDVFNYLQALLPGRSAKNQGFSYNRVVKLLNSNGHLPADFGNILYGCGLTRSLGAGSGTGSVGQGKRCAWDGAKG